MQNTRKRTQNIKEIEMELSKMPDEVRHFSSEEDEILRKYFVTKPTSEIARLLGKTGSQVYNKAYRMGLRKAGK